MGFLSSIFGGGKSPGPDPEVLRRQQEQERLLKEREAKLAAQEENVRAAEKRRRDAALRAQRGLAQVLSAGFSGFEKKDTLG